MTQQLEKRAQELDQTQIQDVLDECRAAILEQWYPTVTVTFDTSRPIDYVEFNALKMILQNSGWQVFRGTHNARQLHILAL